MDIAHWERSMKKWRNGKDLRWFVEEWESERAKERYTKRELKERHGKNYRESVRGRENKIVCV